MIDYKLIGNTINLDHGKGHACFEFSNRDQATLASMILELIKKEFERDLIKPEGFFFDEFYKFLRDEIPLSHYEFIKSTFERCQFNTRQNIQFTEAIRKLVNEKELPDWFVKEIQNIIKGKKP